MEKFIYFEENIGTYCVIRFVKSFRRKSFLRKERIEYSISSLDGTPFTDTDLMSTIMAHIRREYPDSVIYLTDWGTFLEKYEKRVFWLIAHYDNKNKCDGYYSGMNHKSFTSNTDIDDAEIYLDHDSADETLNNIRKSTGEKWYLQPVYLNLINGLLEPNFMITCTSKRGKQQTKYFNRIEDGRLRLVSTSDSAKKFTYYEVLRMFEHLQSENKNFLYVALPVFKDNVNCKDIENYIRENKVSRMIQMTLKLKWLNR